MGYCAQAEQKTKEPVQNRAAGLPLPNGRLAGQLGHKTPGPERLPNHDRVWSAKGLTCLNEDDV